MRCPVALVSEMSGEVFEAVRCWNVWRARGEWPNAGGRFEQSAVLLDLFEAAAEQQAAGVYTA